MKLNVCALLALCAGAPAMAQLVDVRSDPNPGSSNVVVDGLLGPNEYGPGNNQFFVGGGSGFGGTIGYGTLYMDQDANNLYVGFRAGNNLNDNVVILIDSRAGGFTDAAMNDTADPGRNLSTNLTRDSDDQFAPTFLPDFSLVIGQFGMVTFELTGGSLNFLQYSGAPFTGNDPNIIREIAIPKASMALSSSFDFIVGYGSDSNYMSDETIPVQPFTGTGNPGFGGGGPVPWPRWDTFQKAPAPGSLAFLGIAGLAAARRRRA